MQYDPLLKARREVLADLAEELTDEEFVIAEKAVDLFCDKMDYELGHADTMIRNQETGELRIVVGEGGTQKAP